MGLFENFGSSLRQNISPKTDLTTHRRYLFYEDI